MPESRPEMFIPLLGIDLKGQWGIVFEQFEKAGTGVVLQFDLASEPPSTLVDTGIEPYCCTCLRWRQLLCDRWRQVSQTTLRA